MEKIAFTVNDSSVGCKPGTSILDAAAAYGIKIPTLCHHPDLKPHGACRMCLVEEETSGRLMAACVTPAAANMNIRTDSERVLNHRRNIARLMIAEHPESCIVCSKGNRCRLRQTAAELGIGETDLYPMPNFKPFEQANPFIVRDLSKCILCAKCIRADHELVVVGAIDYNLRGFRSRPATVHDQPLEKSSCTFCGTCVAMCPTGALSVRERNHVGTAEKTTRSICAFCSVGCVLDIGVYGDRFVEANPADLPGSVNGSTLCVRGHFAGDYLVSTQRLHSPLLRSREGGTGEEGAAVDWQQAVDAVASRLKETAKIFGPQSIAFVGSAKGSIEENYLLQKIARAVIGTNNLDHGSHVSGRALQARIDQRTGGRWRVVPLSTLGDAELIFLLGADPGHSLPVLGYHIKRAVHAGVPLVVVDPRRTELARMAAHWLPITPGGDLTLINSLSAMLLANGSYDAAFVDRHTEGFSVFRMGLSSLDPVRGAESVGIGMQLLEAVARMLKGKKTVWIAGSGVGRQRGRSQTIDALINLILMTGSWGRPGSGFLLPPKESNAAGAADMGMLPDMLPGRRPLGDPRHRRFWEKIWGRKLSPDPGLSLPRMIEEAEKGNLKALYVMGENPLRALPQRDRVRAALRKIDFLVVQDILAGETVQLADAVLPGGAFAEKSGTFANLEGRIQRFAPAMPPPGMAKADWEILNSVLDALDRDAAYASIDQIRSEIAELIPMYADMGTGITGWLKNDSDPAGADSGRKRISFAPLVTDQMPPEAGPDYPFTALFGTRRVHIGSGTRTSASQRVSRYSRNETVEISPADAAGLELEDGDSVEVYSAHGSVRRKLSVNDQLRPGLVFVPLAEAGNEAINLLPLDFGEEPRGWGRQTCPVGVKKGKRRQ